MKINNLPQARHFEGRLGIGVRYSHLNSLIGQYSAQALDSYLTPDTTAPTYSAPVLTPMSEYHDWRSKSKQERRASRKTRRQEAVRLQRWLLQQIHHSEHPLHSRMLLFWQNHFTNSVRTVRWPALIYRQHQLIHEQALGSFAEMLRGIWKEPAMLMYLNGQQNTQSRPNENFARELLELFTLGEGHYSESDIVNAARAFTGWRYNMAKDQLRFNQRRHDSSEKTFLGQNGHFGAQDIIEILLQQPRTAEFICEKLWHEFISPNTPDTHSIHSWAQTFRDSDYHIPTLLRAMLSSEAFWATEHRGNLIKSPIELIIGQLRELQLHEFDNYKRLHNIARRLGQDPFNPPDVKGWRGGQAWINNSSLIIRHDVIRKILKEHNKQMQMDSGLLQLTPEALPQWLLPIEPVIPPDFTESADNILTDLLLDPVYQLR